MDHRDGDRPQSSAEQLAAPTERVSAVSHRDLSRDGFRNRLELALLTSFPRFWRTVQHVPPLRTQANAFIINYFIHEMKTRPNALSTLSPYTSWESLNDRTYSSRHLPPGALHPTKLPPVADVVALFERTPDHEALSNKSTLLFSHFAQYFTDGFLRTDPANPLKNLSTHDIDLSQLYGQTKHVTNILRSRVGGRLKSQIINGEEYPPYYFNADGTEKEEFTDLPTIYPGHLPGDRKGIDVGVLPKERRTKLFAMGISRGNIHPGFVMLYTLFLREHNRLCDLLAEVHWDWDDERLFHTSRNILIVLLLKIVIEDYINHITPFRFRFVLQPGVGAREKWYRQNWMSVEFNLLYRWHSLVPEWATVGDQRMKMEDTLWYNDLVTTTGLATLFDSASRQPAGEIGLFNTSPFLLDTERSTMEIGRLANLASYNDYRAVCGYPRVTAFDQITGRPDVQAGLKRLYGHVDNLELYVGLFAEDIQKNSALPTLMGTMVGVDAFSQALTNPLLAETVYNEETFSAPGLRTIAQTRSLGDIVHRNIPRDHAAPFVSFTQNSWAMP